MSVYSIPNAKRTSLILWVLAALVTISAAFYQNTVGPRRPIRGAVKVGDETISYSLSRTHAGITDHEVALAASDITISGTVEYRRHRSNDSLTIMPLTPRNGQLVAWLPAQPAAGIVEYRVVLMPAEDGSPVSIPSDGYAAVRFRNSVPGGFLVAHVVLMFVGMLMANRAGLEAIRPGSNPRSLAVWATALLSAGGLVFGPIVQWYSFGEAWTGFPIGIDLTDNKTAIVVLIWVVGLLLGRRSLTVARRWIAAAAVATLIIFSIPHSLLGTELDYATLPEPPNLTAEP